MQDDRGRAGVEEFYGEGAFDSSHLQTAESELDLPSLEVDHHQKDQQSGEEVVQIGGI